MSSCSGKTIDGSYVIGEMFGTGGMAKLYLATDNPDGGTLAVKILKQRSDERRVGK